jgi:pimeloyl-ACP methyl ester carboxylesterase
MDTFFLTQWQAYLRYFDLPGAEPACVYLAGLGGAASAFYPHSVCQLGLAPRRSLIADWLGCGYSDRPEQFSYSIDEHAATIAALLEHLHLKACTVIGHSMGGAVAIVLAAKWPDLVARLVLAEANLDAGGGMFSQSIAHQPEDDFIHHGYQELLQGLRAAAIDGDKIAALFAGVLQVTDPLGLHRTAVSLVQGTQPAWREQLYQLSIPRAYLFGANSLPDEDAERLPTRGIQVAVVSDAGHGMMLENPTGFASVLDTILAG